MSDAPRAVPPGGRWLPRVAAALALTPVTIVSFLLAKRMGRLADRYGPRLFMGLGQLIAAAGLALLLRLGAHVNYLNDLLPALLVFSLGLSCTVAPLTAAVLSDADESNAEQHGEARGDELPEALRTAEGRRAFFVEARQRLAMDGDGQGGERVALAGALGCRAV